MVFGTPTTLTPIWCSFVATPSVSSPPMATTAPTFSMERFWSTISAPPGFLNGFVRLVPRMVPPRWRIPLVASRVRRSCSGGSIRPRHPSRTPMISRPCCSPRRTTARITALSPGQSPPPVRTAIFMAAETRRRAVRFQEWRWRRVIICTGPRKRCFSVYGFRLDLPVGRSSHCRAITSPWCAEPGEQVGIGVRQVAAHQRPQQRAELSPGEGGMAPPLVQPAVECSGDVQELVQERLDPLLGRAGAEELRPQRDAVEGARSLQRHLARPPAA